MQPYFVPYPGYYYLHRGVDIFVILDDVQFNRRGRVHRNQIYFKNNIKKWLTLPLKKKKVDTKILDLEFDLLSDQKLNYLNNIETLCLNKNLNFIYDDLINLNTSPLNFINNLNNKIIKKLDIKCKFLFSSKISKSNLKGEKKIIDICKKLKAKEYINLPGGKEIYNFMNFKKEGIKLTFLSAYEGEKISILNYFCKNINFKI